MKTTIEFLDELSARNGGISDYKLARILGLTTQGVSGYRTKRSFFDDETAVKVAGLLGYEPAFVMACAHAERAARGNHDGTMKVWADIAARYAAGLAAVAFCTLLPMPQNAMAAGFGDVSEIAGNIHYAQRRKRRRNKPFLLSQFWHRLKNPTQNR